MPDMPTRIWLPKTALSEPDRIEYLTTNDEGFDIEYIRADSASETAERLGAMTMLLLQSDYEGAASIAQGIPLAFPSGKPVPTTWAEIETRHSVERLREALRDLLTCDQAATGLGLCDFHKDQARAALADTDSSQGEEK